MGLVSHEDDMRSLLAVGGLVVFAANAWASEPNVRVIGHIPDEAIANEAPAAFSKRLGEALYALDVFIAPACEEQRTFEITKAYAVTPNDPLTIALAKGAPVHRLVVMGKGCGAERMHNAYLFERPGAPVQIQEFLPGHTLASPQLQIDTFRIVMLSMAAVRGPDGSRCPEKARPIGTSVVSEPEGRSPWRELWTVRACSVDVSFDVTFTPDSTGVGFAVTRHKGD
jgi:hypothetical protein